MGQMTGAMRRYFLYAGAHYVLAIHNAIHMPTHFWCSGVLNLLGIEQELALDY